MYSQPADWRLTLIVSLLRDECVIAYPTEGVWGLGCIPESERAVSRILELKRRSWEEGLILAASSIEQIAPWLDRLGEDDIATLESAWPGPVTYLVPDNGYTPVWIKGRHDRVALRVSAHPAVAAICDALKGPIVSTSANPAGRPPATSSFRVRQYFPHGIDYLVPGQIGGATGPSEIRDLVTGDVIRPAQGHR